MKLAPARTFHLIVAVLVLSVAIIAIFTSRPFDNLGSDAVRVAGYRITAVLGFVLNLAIAIWGIFGAHRWFWIAYLLVSIACITWIYGATPIVALYLYWASRACGAC